MITIKGPIHFKAGEEIPDKFKEAVLKEKMLPFKEVAKKKSAKKKSAKKSLKGKLRRK